MNWRRYHIRSHGEYNATPSPIICSCGGRDPGSVGQPSEYQTLSAANSQTTNLGEKTRQLISLAVAVTTRCDGCIVFHTDAALKAGATREEISEALGVAVGMNAGAALIYSARVLDAVEAKSPAVRA